MWCRVLSGLFFVVLSAQGFSTQFRYNVDNVLLSSEDCRPTADSLRVEFKRQTGIEPILVDCGSESFEMGETTYYLGHFVTRYEAEKKLPLFSTFEASALAQGNFKNLSECRAALAARRAEFVTQTGVEPVIAGCAFDTYYRDFPFFILMDNLVETDVTVFQSNQEIIGNINGTFDDIRHEIEQNARRYQLKLIDVAVEEVSSLMGSFRVTMRYFSPKKEKTFFGDHLFEFAGELQCNTVRPQIIAALEELNEPVLANFCLAQEHFDEVRLMVFARYQAIDSFQDWISYDSTADCRADLPAEIVRAKSLLNAQAVSGFCYDSQGKSKLSIIYKRARSDG